MIDWIADKLAIAYLLVAVKVLEGMERHAAWKARRRVRRIQP